ncbi:MAG: HIT domain-containing protein [Desulfoplanes sp.]|nr:HIT domain-containing protein [Desulfoplanes sp.]
MDTLWAPWRIDYILGPKPDTCVFCIPSSTEEDEQRLILYRAKYCFVIMNKYPYSSGHLMVTPYKHVQTITDLLPEESHEIMDYLQITSAILTKAFHPQGMNIGLNMGQASGAGIEEHLHFHLVPRWVGDHSFMAVTAGTMVLPEHLNEAYKKLRPHFAAL